MAHPRPARAALVTLTLAAITVTATACTPRTQPTPNPTTTASGQSTSPTSTPTLSEQDQNIADAKAAYLAYVAAYDAAAQAGFINGNLNTAAFELTSGDAREAIVAAQAAFESNGLHQTGSTVVKSVQATEYQEDVSDAALHRVKLRACVDPSGSDTVFSDGRSTTPTDQPQYRGPRYVHVQVQRQPGGNWTVANEEARPEERC